MINESSFLISFVVESEKAVCEPTTAIFRLRSKDCLTGLLTLGSESATKTVWLWTISDSSSDGIFVTWSIKRMVVFGVRPIKEI